MPDTVCGSCGRVLPGDRGVRLCVSGAVRLPGGGGCGRLRLDRVHMDGRRHLAQEHDEGDQAPMSQASHGRRVSPRPRRGIRALTRLQSGEQEQSERARSYVSGSAMDLTWVPCTRETTATGRPLLSLGVTLTAR